MLKILLILSTIFFSNRIFAYSNANYIKAGFSYAVDKMFAMSQTHDETKNFGINTSYGHKWINHDIFIGSSIYFGKVEDLSFEAAGSTYRGDGTFKSVSVRPTYKYLFDVEVFSNWKIYLSISPQWSIQTIKFKTLKSNNQLPLSDFKLTFESFGGAIGIGVEEQTLYKEMNPVFIEVIFIKRNPYKVSVVDISDTAQINIISTNSLKKDIGERIILVNIGVTLF